MIIKYEDIGDQVVVNVPDSAYWEIRYRQFSDPNDDYYKLCLITGGKEFTLLDVERWSDYGTLAATTIGALYEDIAMEIARRLEKNPDLSFIDINAIESDVIKAKYKEKWIAAGYKI